MEEETKCLTISAMMKSNLNLHLPKYKFKSLNPTKNNHNKKKHKRKKDRIKNLRKKRKRKIQALIVKAGIKVWIINKLKMNKSLKQEMGDQEEDRLRLNKNKTIRF